MGIGIPEEERVNWTDNIEVTCEDCMELMARYPDNHFDLAIVDPPYGIGIGGNGRIGGNGKITTVTQYAPVKWDSSPPDQMYFSELKRVSKNRIIWGANNFNLPPSAGWIVWDKKTIEWDDNFSDAELAFTSFLKSVRVFRHQWMGALRKKTSPCEVKRIHPTQKPVKLYEWILFNYAKQGDKILDTHLGSGSHAVACHNLRFKLTACEIDKDYYNAARKRFKTVTSQLAMF